LALALTLAGCPEGIPVPDPTPMVSLPGGEFTMGWARDCTDDVGQPYCDPSAWAERRVDLSPFAIDRHEVTNAQYRYCVAAGGCEEPIATGIGDKDASDYYNDAAYDNHPVIFVTWEMADSYCRFLDRRLPTEAEWEFAARTRKDGKHDQFPRAYPWSPEADPPRKIGGVCEGARLKVCGEETPGAVESIAGDRSDWGIRDLGGNVAEWVADLFYMHGYCRDEKSLEEECGGDASCVQSSCFDASAPKADCVLLCTDMQTPFCLKELNTLKDPKAERGGPDRVFRGGSFVDGLCIARSISRRHIAPSSAQAWSGFRCAGTSQ
jgi:formylglycine-generating enzyme required for sulfatase activity